MNQHANFIPRYANVYPSPIILSTLCRYCGAKMGDVCSTKDTGLWAKVIHKARIDEYENRIQEYQTDVITENNHANKINIITKISKQIISKFKN